MCSKSQSDITGTILSKLQGLPHSFWSAKICSVVIADGSGNLIKVDVRLSAWYFESEQMKGVMRNVVSAAVVASTIDINKIDENAIRRMVRDGCRPDKQWEVLDKILEGRNVTSKHQQ